MRKIVSTNLRFNLERAEDRRAWEHLQRMDRSKFRSYTRAVIAAVNDFFERQAHGDDPYLETRAKEDAFLKEVREAIEQGMKNAAPLNLLSLLQGNLTPNVAENEDTEADGEDMDAAMDFIDSF